MRKEYLMLCFAFALIGTILISNRAVAPKVLGPEAFAPAPSREGSDRALRGAYANTRFGFEISYPDEAVVGPVGSDGKLDPEGEMFVLSMSDETREFYVYRPLSGEARLTPLEFAKAAVRGADKIDTLQGRSSIAVAYAKSGIVRFGNRALVAEHGSALFIRRPGYYLITMLYGSAGSDPGRVEDVMTSLKFKD